MTDKIVVLSTCGTQEEGERLARSLVEQRLAACVNLLPRIRSIYRWNGAIETGEEHLLVIKSSRDRLPALIALLKKEHSYEVPEVVALPVVDGATEYLDWLQASLESEPG